MEATSLNTTTKVDRLRALADHGLVTTRDARAVGMAPAELARMAYKGRLLHELRGIYRFPDVAQDQYSDYRLALAWGRIAGSSSLDSASALLLWGLCDPFDSRGVKCFGIHVMIPRSRRIRTLGRPHYWWATGDSGAFVLDSGLPVIGPVQAVRRSLDQGLIHTGQARAALDRGVELGLIDAPSRAGAEKAIRRWIRVGTFGWKDPMLFAPTIKRPPPIHRGA